MAEILYKELSFLIIGAAMEVHRTLRPGFLESVYQAALARELSLRGVSFEQLKHLSVKYKDIIVGEYIADFVIDDKIILEIKAVSSIHPKHVAQAVNYLTATGLKLAIIINFGADSLQQERAIH